MDYLILSIYFFSGLVAVTLIDTAGAVASRKLNFDYSYFCVLSFAVYIALAYFVSKQFGLKAALISNAIVGLYEGTVGFWLSIKLRANNGLSEEDANTFPGRGAAVVMMVLSLVLGLAGYGLSLI